MVRNIDIRFVVPVKDAAVAAADILWDRHTNIRDVLSVHLIVNFILTIIPTIIRIGIVIYIINKKVLKK